MLQTIRERAQGWIAWAIVILISVPFALWGIQSYLGAGGEPTVASVNGKEITERDLDNRYRSVRAQLRERLGAAYRPELFDSKTIRSQVLDEMIRSAVLLQASQKLGLKASDQELRATILSNPAFQKNGSFDNATYERMLQLQGMTPLQYEESLRQQIVGSQLARTIIATERVLNDELAEDVRLDRQRRRVSYVRVPKSAFLSDAPIPDKEIAAYYEENRSQFKIPERIKVQYLVLDPESIAPSKAPTEQELRELYKTEKARFTQPERRRVRHILIALDASADKSAEEKAKAKIAQIRQKIKAGGHFAELAKEFSQDPGSAGKGGDLGLIEKGVMTPAFDEAAFSLKEGQLSKPVRTQFGYHLIQVTKVEKGATKPFEEVKGELTTEFEKRGSEGRFYDMAERLANLTYESPDSLEPAAKALGLKLQTSGWIDRSGGKGLLANPKVIAAAFSDEVLKEGNNSDVIEPERNRLQAVVLRVLEHEDAATKPLNEVHDRIVTILRDKRAADAAAAKAAKLADALTGGQELAVVARDYKIEDLGLIARNAEQVPAEIRAFAFTLARPGQKSASQGSLSLTNGDGAVVLVTEVADGALKGLDKASADKLRETLAQGIGRAYYEDWLSDLEAKASVERTPTKESEDNL